MGYRDRTIGQRYGATVRCYDLMNKLLNELQFNPMSRRHIINLYQYSDFEETKGLHPCAMETHWSVCGKKLNLTLIQRSSDILVAYHINQIQYIALQMMVARYCGYEVGNFCHYVHNVHIYDRNLHLVGELIKRYHSLSSKDNAALPTLELNPAKRDFYSFTIDDFTLKNYSPIFPNLQFSMAI